MQRLLTAQEVEGRLDCYGNFDRQDDVCVTRCGLNVSCAILKGRSATLHACEQASLYFDTPSIDY
jgi:hypothetical protein